MLIPKRTKYRKQHRPDRHGMSKGGNEINFGDFAIQAMVQTEVFSSLYKSSFDSPHNLFHRNSSLAALTSA